RTNTGVRKYDVITAINGSDVRSLDDLYRAVDELMISGVMNVVINADGVVRRLVLHPTVGPQIAPSVSLSLWTDGYNGSHARIHFYENITTAGCGVGRKGMLRDNTCFTYHPNSDTMFASIQNGRVVQTGEMPWTVYITNNLGGCGPNCTMTDIRVYPGLTNQSIANYTYYTGGQYFITPEYALNQWQPFDLGLIRLNTAIPLDGTSGVTGINAICLPEEWVVNEDKEYVILNGFGAADDNGTGSGVQRIGFARIERARNDPNHTLQRNAALYARRIPFPSGSATCK
ncbi:unnamed protein product, partial [Medioppia subpectinata]